MSDDDDWETDADFENNLTETEQKILDVLDATEQPIDTLIDRTGLPVSSVSVALLGLEMKRLAKQLPGKLFARR